MYISHVGVFAPALVKWNGLLFPPTAGALKSTSFGNESPAPLRMAVGVEDLRFADKGGRRVFVAACPRPLTGPGPRCQRMADNPRSCTRVYEPMPGVRRVRWKEMSDGMMSQKCQLKQWYVRWRLLDWCQMNWSIWMSDELLKLTSQPPASMIRGADCLIVSFHRIRCC